ncbi:MAG: hypothetical protein AB8B91_13385 [Rubripirellula sp.]
MTDTTLPETAPAQTQPAVLPPPLRAGDKSVKAEPGTPPLAPFDDQSDSDRLLDDPRVPAFLVSTILHTLILLLLALLTYHGAAGTGGESLTARLGEPNQVVTLQVIENQLGEQMVDSTLSDEPIAVVISPADAVPITSPLQIENPSEMDPTLVDLSMSGGASSSRQQLKRLPSGGGLEGRTPEGRLELGRKYGATQESEAAVDAALEWIAKHQRPNGSWSFNLNLDPCNGRCRHSKKKGDTPTPSTGATGLALLAFLGAGHTHHDNGDYSETIRRGIYYLRSVAGETETGLDWQQGSMYGHGIALMALGEALAMTTEGDRRDSDLVNLVSRGAAFSCIAQHDSGSWGYVPGSPGDTTVTGWQVLSLVAAKRNKISLQTYTLTDAREFVMSTCKDRDYSFGYKGPPGEPTTTAIGLALLMYLGESPDYTPYYMALTDMSERGPTLSNIYHDYYATLALHHCRHPDWDRWNTKLRDHLVATQAKSGHEAGSWHFADRWGDVGGRLYTTAMAAMTLEVYYRYMPLYESIDEFTLD